ncbi:hypothetical protein FOMPIDRAFT_97971 [Fomitopsis schrenkii]|uniref:HAUS augmin-like complex subunit 6 N-terminal domain-containing protein n=1 Tax=Fomitopsis schrenkii TaxID=2126942 RepID=S8EDJ4_FOMSC|nr:hypothetical protein FOMPIDRAFT_97971 [Fomitopsis schrenkii]
MEDIAYFLVGKLEGSRGRAKSILPTYPCIQPSDTTAFRVSLSKYLETLRHSSIYPSHGEDKQRIQDPTRGPATKNSDVPQPQAAAWWWQDVVVRKSLLEECSGERFERLLLAVSTHALFANTTRLTVPGSVSQAEVSRHAEAIQALPRAYASVLELSQSARREWERAASRLVQQQGDLSVLRERLLNPTATSSSKFASLSTGRLVALRDSRVQDLLTTWKDESGRRALHFLIDIAGLEASSATIDASRPLQAPDVAEDKTDVQCAPRTPFPVPPLPIAAAHHPGILTALHAPLFAPPTKSISTNAAVSEGNTRVIQDPTNDRLAERVASTERTHQTLLDAALRLDNVRLDLERRSCKPRPTPVTRPSPHLGIWEVPSRTPIDFRTPNEAPSSSTAEPPVDTAVEERIARIRNSLLPAWPEPPAPSPSDLELEAEASHLPLPSQKGRLRPQDAKRSAGDVKVASVALQVQKPKVFGEMDKSRTLNTDARKVSAKVSRRQSAARARRTTLLLRHKLYDDEVSRIVDAVEDGSPTFEAADGAQTPKTRLGTAGSLLSTVKKTLPRPSFDIDKHERAIDVPLPKLRLSSLDTHDLHAEISPNRREAHGPLSAADQYSQPDADEEEFYEGHSVTLRDILLKATDINGPQHNLLAEEEDDLEDEAFEW